MWRSGEHQVNTASSDKAPGSHDRPRHFEDGNINTCVLKLENGAFRRSQLQLIDVGRCKSFPASDVGNLLLPNNVPKLSCGNELKKTFSTGGEI